MQSVLGMLLHSYFTTLFFLYRTGALNCMYICEFKGESKFRSLVNIRGSNSASLTSMNVHWELLTLEVEQLQTLSQELPTSNGRSTQLRSSTHYFPGYFSRRPHLSSRTLHDHYAPQTVAQTSRHHKRGQHARRRGLAQKDAFRRAVRGPGQLRGGGRCAARESVREAQGARQH